MERRLSSLVAPAWLLPNKINHVNVVFAKTPEEENNTSSSSTHPSNTIVEQQRVSGNYFSYFTYFNQLIYY